VEEVYLNKSTRTEYLCFLCNLQPYIIDMFRNNSKSNALENFPEMAIFHNGLSNINRNNQLRDKDELKRFKRIFDTHIRGLMAFLYSLNLKSNEIIPVYDKTSKRLFFIPADYTLADIEKYYEIKVQIIAQRNKKLRDLFRENNRHAQMTIGRIFEV
jgi:hypothetical protein